MLRTARHAIRGLRRTPTFALLAILTIALGTGVNTAVFGLVLTQTFLPVGAGLAAATAMAPLLATQVHGITPRDPASIASSIALLGAVAGLAALVPARHALRIDPIEAIRQE
jgi:ABC-type antimicrobial peptide transport system permease subunit